MIAGIGEVLFQCFMDNKKLLVCGQNETIADAHCFARSFTQYFESERPALIALALTEEKTSFFTHCSPEKIFSRQIQAMGHPGDILCILTFQTLSPCVRLAIEAAREQEMIVIVIAGQDQQDLVQCAPVDYVLHISSYQNSVVREVMVLILHSLSDVVDCLLLGLEE